MKKILGFLFKGKRKFISIPVIIAIVAFMLFGGKKPLPTYPTITLKNDEIKNTIIVTGQSSVLKQSTITSKTGGDVEEVFVKLGDDVKIGDKILKLSNNELNKKLEDLKIERDIQINSSQTNVSGVKLKYEQALKTYNDNKILFSNGAISADTLNTSKNASTNAYESYRTALKSSNTNSLRIQNINNKINRLKEDIDNLVIKSNIDGKVSKINFSLYDKVPANQNIAIIEDSSVLEITANVNQFDAGKLKNNQTIKLYENKTNAKKYDAKINEISPSGVKAKSGKNTDVSIPIKILFDNSENVFKANFPLKIEIVTEQKENAISAPYEAIRVKGDGKRYVYKIVDGSTEETEVKYGIEGDIKVEILSEKLKEGDVIVTKVDDKLANGIKIEIEEVREVDDKN